MPTRISPFRPKEEHRKLVRQLAACGLSHTQICAFLINDQTDKPIARSTLEKWFWRELSQGSAVATEAVAKNLYRIATSPDVTNPVVTAAMFWMRCKAGWSDKPKQEDTQEDNGQLGTAAIEALKSKIDRLAGREDDTVIPFPTNATRS